MTQMPPMPDVTRAQIVALVQAIIGVAVAFGAPISDTQSTALLGLVGAIAVVLPLADAMLRRGRARMIAELGTFGDLDLVDPPPDVGRRRAPVTGQLTQIETEAEAERAALEANRRD